MIFEDQVDPGPVRSATLAVVGYGNQGRAQALNLRDRGLSVVVGSRPGTSRDRAESDGFAPTSVAHAVADAEVVFLAVPDEAMGVIVDSEVRPALRPDATVVFAHGFAVTFGQVTLAPGQQGVLVSPVGPGTAVREEFVAGGGVPAFVASLDDAGWPMALAYSWAIGCARGGLVKTTFREETVCDLFGEQTVLCGGMPELAVAAFDTLVGAGYSPEAACMECVLQIRLLADLVARYGVAGMKEKISDTAEWGSYKVGPRVVGEPARAAMREALADIESGSFAREWLEEAASGKKRLHELRRRSTDHPLEKTVRALAR